MISRKYSFSTDKDTEIVRTPMEGTVERLVPTKLFADSTPECKVKRELFPQTPTEKVL